jgi:hypothetical protein
MSINEENKDLIENRIPWGLLDKETQERMLGWKYGWSRCFQYETPSGWIITNLRFVTRDCEVYRAKPAPERRECFVNAYPQGVAQIDANWTGLSYEKLARFKIAFDEDGSNPTIEVVKENE